MDFDRLGHIERHMHPVGNVVSNQVAAHRDNRRMPDSAFNKNSQVGCPAADVDDDRAHLFFFGVSAPRRRMPADSE